VHQRVAYYDLGLLSSPDRFGKETGQLVERTKLAGEVLRAGSFEAMQPGQLDFNLASVYSEVFFTRIEGVR
jgi:hypothetical protein